MEHHTFLCAKNSNDDVNRSENRFGSSLQQRMKDQTWVELGQTWNFISVLARENVAHFIPNFSDKEMKDGKKCVIDALSHA